MQLGHPPPAPGHEGGQADELLLAARPLALLDEELALVPALGQGWELHKQSEVTRRIAHCTTRGRQAL